MKNQLTKEGLTGGSGFGVESLEGIWHLNANYAATEGHVFVETKDVEYIEWRRVKTEDAKGHRIISCSYCKNPAISLDHSWPYLTEATYCADHRDWQKWSAEREG